MVSVDCDYSVSCLPRPPFKSLYSEEGQHSFEYIIVVELIVGPFTIYECRVVNHSTFIRYELSTRTIYISQFMYTYS